MRSREAVSIGVTACLDSGASFGSTLPYAYSKRNYLVAVRAAGGFPILLTPDFDPATVLDACRGLVITGGADVPPSDYGAITEPGTVCEARERVDWERRLVTSFVAAHRPILAVCYGMQLLNVHFGGTLHQHPPAGTLDHGSPERPLQHGISVDPRSRLARVLPATTRVTSAHRQTIATLAPGCLAAATAADGSVEAIERDGALGVAWHPERDGTGVALYAALVADARR